MIYNPQEQALRNTPPVFTPIDPVPLAQAKDMAGLGYVPNELLAGKRGGASLADTALGAAAGPWGAVAGGIASALGAPPPSLTANVSANPSVKYGDKYLENLVGASKTGQFVVSSGASNPNAENRGAPSSTQGFGPPVISNLASMPLWIWVAIGVVALFAIRFLVRRK